MMLDELRASHGLISGDQEANFLRLACEHALRRRKTSVVDHGVIHTRFCFY